MILWPLYYQKKLGISFYPALIWVHNSIFLRTIPPNSTHYRTRPGHRRGQLVMLISNTTARVFVYYSTRRGWHALVSNLTTLEVIKEVCEILFQKSMNKIRSSVCCLMLLLLARRCHVDDIKKLWFSHFPVTWWLWFSGLYVTEREPPGNRTCVPQFVNPSYRDLWEIVYLLQRTVWFCHNIPIFDSEIELHIGENGEMLTWVYTYVQKIMSSKDCLRFKNSKSTRELTDSQFQEEFITRLFSAMVIYVK